MPSHYTRPKYLEQRPTAVNNAPSIPNPDGSWNPGPGVGTAGGYANPYDPRIGNGALPIGITGSQERAYTRGVQGDELSRTHLQTMLDQNGAYIQSARQSGVEFANRRGLVNSSIAAGNSQRSAIESAAPFALSDANAYREAAGQNLQYLNERQLADIRSNDNSNNNATQLAVQRMQDEGALWRQRENLAFSGEQNGLDRVQDRDMVGYRSRANDWEAGRSDQRRDYYGGREAYRNDSIAGNRYRQNARTDALSDTYAAQLATRDYAMRNPGRVSVEYTSAINDGYARGLEDFDWGDDDGGGYP